MNKKQQRQLDKLIREELNLRGKGCKAAAPFISAAHKVHRKWVELYNKYTQMQDTTKK